MKSVAFALLFVLALFENVVAAPHALVIASNDLLTWGHMAMINTILVAGMVWAWPLHKRESKHSAKTSDPRIFYATKQAKFGPNDSSPAYPERLTKQEPENLISIVQDAPPRKRIEPQKTYVLCGSETQFQELSRMLKEDGWDELTPRWADYACTKVYVDLTKSYVTEFSFGTPYYKDRNVVAFADFAAGLRSKVAVHCKNETEFDILKAVLNRSGIDTGGLFWYEECWVTLHNSEGLANALCWTKLSSFYKARGYTLVGVRDYLLRNATVKPMSLAVACPTEHGCNELLEVLMRSGFKDSVRWSPARCYININCLDDDKVGVATAHLKEDCVMNHWPVVSLDDLLAQHATVTL